MTALEKIVLVEIDSLDSVDGCYCSNEYLAEFCQCTERKISSTISKLISLGYIVVESFDGRKRILRSRLEETSRLDRKNFKADGDIHYISNNIDNNITLSKDRVCSTDVQRVIDEWNNLPSVRKITKLMPTTIRYKLLMARIKDYGVDNILRAIENIRSSSFLLGDNRKNWQITFDWFVKPNNFPKVLDGNYENRDDSKKDDAYIQKSRLTANDVGKAGGTY